MPETQNITRDYKDNFSIKDMGRNVLVPKFFPDTDISNLNVGAIGYITELSSAGLEDTFNTVSSLYEEMFPNRAKLPSSIYSHASIYQLSDGIANAASCTFFLMLDETSIISNATSKNGVNYFYIDKNTKILVQGIIFTIDYDIEIRAVKKESHGNYSFSAQYVTKPYGNNISNITNPYIKLRRSPGYVLLEIVAHQCVRTVKYEPIVDNTKINLPTIELQYNDQLAGFDVFYKSPTDTTYSVQMQKLIEYSSPLKTPFCYYRIGEEGILRITFSNKDSYFQPKFNSELMIVLYTTNGKAGTFDMYKGSDITVIPDSSTYAYNANIAIAAKPMSASVGGTDITDLETLQALTVENYRIANAYTTDNDLNSYFENFIYRYGSECKFMKSRDDAADRLFKGFLIMKKDDYIYPTNTLGVKLNLNQLTTSDGYKYTLNPGYLFKYENGGDNVMLLNNPSSMITYIESYNQYIESNPREDKYSIYDYMKESGYDPKLSVFDENISQYENIGDFLYTNPFLIVISKRPNLVGLYLTIVNQSAILDFVDQNSDIFDQFIIDHLELYRKLSKEKKYDVTTMITPSSSYTASNNPVQYINDPDGMKSNKLRVIMTLSDSMNQELCYIELTPTEKTLAGVYKFECPIGTDDHITSTNKFRLIGDNIVRMTTAEDLVIPITGVKAKIYTLYKDGNITNNKFAQFDSTLNGYVWTNQYITDSDPLTFIRPLNMVRSMVSFDDDRLGTVNIGDVTLSAFPFIKYSLVNDEIRFSYFIEKFISQYTYLEQAIDYLQTSSHIDVKLYNTYGKSKNFVVGDSNEQLIDTINIKISYDIWVTSTTDVIQAKKELRSFIKKYIEEINENGTNNFYNSNLVRAIENQFSYVHHTKFNGINSYNPSIQTVKNNTVDLSSLSKDLRRKYVPEILVVNEENIDLRFYTV